MIMIAHKFSLLRQLLLAATLAIGFGMLWSLLLLWLGTSIQEAWRGGQRSLPPRENLVVRSDGTPLVVSTPSFPGDLSAETCRDLSGRAQAVPDRDDLLAAVYLVGAHGVPDFSWSGWHHRLSSFIDEREPSVNWFFVHDGKRDGAGYFAGYDRVSNRCVGFIGLSRFRRQSVPAADWIPVRGELMRDYSMWSSAPFHAARTWVPRLNRWDVPPRLVYVPSANHLRLVDLAARTVTTVFEAPEPIESPGIPTLANWTSGRPAREQPILVRTRRQIYVLDRKHNVIRVFIIPTELDRQSPAQWYEIGSGRAVAVFSRPWSAGEPDNVTREIVYRISSDGAIQEQFELTLKNGSRARSKQAEAILLAIGLPAPAILFVVDLVSLIWIDRIPAGPSVLPALLGTSGFSFFLVLALASVLAIVVWRRSRSFGLPQRDQITWAVFVLLFGFAAYVGFLLHRRWPIRQPCPSCHAEAPRDRAACVECGTRFPVPALRGIEIFA
jgi:hypothetical protein